MSSYPVRDHLDIFEPRRAIRLLGLELGFTPNECLELAIVVSELASNIVKYGVTGTIEMAAINEQGRKGVIIVASDRGPPFRDLDMALQDGCDDLGPIDPAKLMGRRGLGTGLGAVVRFTDSFHVDPVLYGGKAIRVLRYVKRPRRSRRPR